jgi:predicted permease
VNVLAGLVPVFLIMAAGVAARQLRLLDDAGAAGLNRLVANLALPALLLIKVGTASLRQSFSVAVVAVAVGVVVGTTVVALGVARLWRLPAAQVGVLAQAAMRGNLAYVAFPVILAAGGDAALRQAAVASAVIIPVMNLLAVGVLELGRARRGLELRLAVKVLLNPLVIGALAGLALSALAWRPWGWLADTLNALAAFALPAALLALGAQLKLGRWGKVWKPATVAASMKLAAMPAATWFLLRLAGASPQGTMVGVLLLAAPTAVASYPVAVDLGGDPDLAGACVVLTTVVAFVSYLGWNLLVAG